MLDAFMANMDEWGVDYCIKVVVFDARDMEVAKLVYERYHDKMADEQFFLSLGNVHPPHLDTYDDDIRKPLLEEMIYNFQRLFDDIKKDSILTQIEEKLDFIMDEDTDQSERALAFDEVDQFLTQLKAIYQ
ncbi:hypothetical protein GP486_008624 [Trichoglossum hirsutum]|uniref:Uncharacterized protein n=1 Tax=Trichoglossum hirsutum TaxID=265104 RepID=A0A9P8IC00_9PEZI|nr:hypothetical protein GP486_008624 [Trichoglossum hirsutum]